MRSELYGVVAVGMLILAAGCEVPRSDSDSESPLITITVSEGRGNPVYKSDESRTGPDDDCINVPSVPVELSMVVGDAGGVQSAWIKVFPATIDPSSVTVTPASPEGEYSITSERGADTLLINLTAPSETTVRTGATAVFTVNGSLPIAVQAYAIDFAGNRASLPQFDLRALTDAAICRGE